MCNDSEKTVLKKLWLIETNYITLHKCSDEWLAHSLYCTCIFLRPHWSIDDPLEGCYPIPLLCLSLAGKQELPVWRNYGDAIVPVVALGGWRQSSQNGIAVLLAAYEHLTTGVGILGGGVRGKICEDSVIGQNKTKHQGLFSYQWIFKIHESPVVHSEPPLLKALCVLWQRTGRTQQRKLVYYNKYFS